MVAATSPRGALPDGIFGDARTVVSVTPRGRVGTVETLPESAQRVLAKLPQTEKKT